MRFFLSYRSISPTSYLWADRVARAYRRWRWRDDSAKTQLIFSQRKSFNAPSNSEGSSQITYSAPSLRPTELYSSLLCHIFEEILLNPRAGPESFFVIFNSSTFFFAIKLKGESTRKSPSSLCLVRHAKFSYGAGTTCRPHNSNIISRAFHYPAVRRSK